MRRIHAFEFNDSDWVPEVIRESIVETLGRGLRWGRIYDGVAPSFRELLGAWGDDSVLDLGTGTGEPVSILIRALERLGVTPPRFLLSDLHPNVAAMELIRRRHPNSIAIAVDPIDATSVPPSLDQPARMLVDALHHLTPQAAARVLTDAARSGRAIFVLEGFPRSFVRFLPVLVPMALSVFANPLLAPRRRLLKAFLTYVIPVVPLAGLWDAVVSLLRVYSESELRAFVAGCDSSAHVWHYREIPFGMGLGRAVAFWGVPVEATEKASVESTRPEEVRT
jgi:hypothetical protein